MAKAAHTMSHEVVNPTPTKDSMTQSCELNQSESMRTTGSG